ncbi:hypothetical protein EXU85_13205 [Spirosoma sp. KCTC 42546]|uniref:hypothetical protein n=1 Tax=Spirosoma sp. KCTC 42546 TaxID=2520506 RepID=UPI00115B127C|nr:hypothetical protein [Spirosoma sp. KCTC 42546]QDK79509.1 hypothetical protein EXU85_13205 [Spirosoma sp. KCTC 42546]
MELDEFKALYQSRFEQVPQKSGADLEDMLRRRSSSAVERILRNLLWEVGAAFVIVLGLAFVMATWSSNIFRWLGLGVVLLSLVQVIAFSWQYQQLKAQLSRATGSVRHHLQDTVGIVSRFVRLYYRYCMRLIPVGMVVGGLLGGYAGVTGNTTDPALAALPENSGLVFLLGSLVLAVALAIGTYFMLTWYIQRLYGRYLDELNACLRDLTELAS